MTKPRGKAPEAEAPEMPYDTCGGCYFCHAIKVDRAKVLWCFVDPPFPLMGDEPAGFMNRGAETKADTPACQHFKPKGVH